MMKKSFAILLAALFLCGILGGCQPQNAAEHSAESNAIEPLAAGRYGEGDIALPLPEGASEQMLLGMGEGPDGQFAITCVYEGNEDNFRCRYFRHTIAENGAVTTREESWLNELAPQGGNELHVLSGQGNALYMCFSDYDADGNSHGHILVSRDGGKTGEELTGDGVAAMGMVTGFGVLSDGRIAATNFYDGTLLLLDSSGNRIEALSSGNQGRIENCAANGDVVAFTVPDGKCVRVYNTVEKTYTDYDFRFTGQDVAMLAVGADNAVFLANSTGLYRHAAGGAVWEKLVDGETSTLGLPNFYTAFFTVSENGEYPTFHVSDLRKLLTYTYDPMATATADTALTVFSLTANDTVRQAIVAFSRTHSNVKVTYTVAMENATGGTEQDYIKALNTELLAGTGPDILLLDGLPIDSYVEKDVLTDLSAITDHGEPLVTNVVSALSQDGKLYCIPTGFRLPFAVTAPGTEAAFDSLGALADAAEAAGATPLLSPCAFSYKTLSYALYQYYGALLQSGDAQAVESFLTDSKRISDAIYCTDRLGEGWDALKEMSQDELYDTFHDYFGSPQIFAAASGTTQSVLMQPVGSVFQCMEPLTIADAANASLTAINGQFVPVGIVGVNKASAEQEAAAAFVQTLLSYSAQGGNTYADQFPVNAQALSEVLAYENDGVSSGFMLNNGADFTSTWPKKIWRDRLGTLIQSLDTPMLSDGALMERLLPEIEAYLDGSSTLQQSAEQMQSLLSTYLSE